MATRRTSFTSDESLAERARRLDINIPAAAREGVTAAVKRAMGESDRAAYQRFPEQPDSFWNDTEAWGKPHEPNIISTALTDRSPAAALRLAVGPLIQRSLSD